MRANASNTGKNADSPEKVSQNRQAFEQVRDAILSGKLLPGTRLNIATLADELGVSTGAVREGLAMLEAEAMVTSSPARGYRVSTVSAKELRDLVEARIEIEKLCLTAAIQHGDLDWESGIVAAFYQMKRSRELAKLDAQRFTPQGSAMHTRFHRSLLAACPNQWLLKMYDILFQQGERYRQLSRSMPRSVERNVEAEHLALMNAVLARDTALAHELIANHLQATARLILDSPSLKD